MTKTTNFNLSQWAKSDRIQMADFNADNSKIEAALTRALVEPRLIKTVTLTTQQAWNYVPVDDIDWAARSVAGIEVPYRPDSSDTASLAIHANSGSPNSYCANGKLGLMSVKVNPCAFVLLPMRDPERCVSAVSFIPNGGYGYSPDIQFKDLTHLRMIYNNSTKRFPAGQKLHIWGIR